MKRWPEATPWKDSKTWKIYSKILKKLLNLKKKKKSFQRLKAKKDQTIYKGNRIRLSWAVCKATYRTKNMKQHYQETKRNYEPRIL